ncbi:heavy-metal-associated domain-containing protein [Cellulomonas fimi]|uniref:Heavy-metal-associated domain-containing protein n=1 Tax=Cellulomonas fimi TaxID=1708 RepID=A0A7Y0LX23_CELFI|nr:heavy-metal-associated domain-containing protein [Cellulomonas fimi]NMR19494.1 heavy-metal-associated domain-containing protein [Cellulomonas fimi]
MVATRFSVEGLTCGLCLAELLDQLRSVPEVMEAAADLVIGGATVVVVTGDAEVLEEPVRGAVERAGFLLGSHDRLLPPHAGADHLLAARAFALGDEATEVLGSDVVTGGVRR